MRNAHKNCDSDKENGKPSLFARLRKDTGGNTLAMCAAAMIPIVGMIGSGLDMSRAYMAQSKLQNACDAAALAGRREMQGGVYTSSVSTEANRFFDFNFPDGTMNAQNISFSISQDASDGTRINGAASADIPTTLMAMFGKTEIPINVECDAQEDYGNNDIMIVLDVTGSMNWFPGTSSGSGQAGTKIARLRDGAEGLYNALANTANTRTRFGIMPYSVSTNVGADLRTTDIRRWHYYTRINSSNFYTYYTRHIDHTIWYDSASDETTIQNWQANDDACVDERGDIGSTPWFDNGVNLATNVMDTTVTQADIDTIATDADDYEQQWGIMAMPNTVRSASTGSTFENNTGPRCPAPASRLQVYGSQTAFNTAIDDATAEVGGSTYHDLGIIWGARYLSSSGMFAADNPTTFNGIPVSKHIVFMTDGVISTTGSRYTAYGVQNHRNRVDGNGSQTANQRHIARFQSACSRAKAMGMTIWVIALDVGNADDIEPCATSSGHYFESDGTDLENVFERIGQGIGQLRLTR